MANSKASAKWRHFLQPTRQDSALTLKPVKSTQIKSQPNCTSKQIGSLTAKYIPTQAVLGEGNAGRVFVAVRRADGRSVAIKQFKRQTVSEPTDRYVAKILAEFGIAAPLRHSNICQNFELVRDEKNQWYQVMEYAPRNLFDRVCSTGMTREEIDCTFKQLVAGFSYLHQSGIAHRDIKLENVVYTESGVMKIIDFGVATTWDGSSDKRIVNDLAGCRPYMAPEIISGKSYNPQCTDVWSLAILYCSMVLGRFPWSEASLQNREYAQFLASSATSLEPQTKRHDNSENTRVIHNIPTGISIESHWEPTDRHAKKSPVCIVVEVSPSGDMDDIREVPPWKPSRQFSKQSWNLVSTMLHVDGQQRASLQQIERSSWVRNTQLCVGNRQHGTCTHTHV